MLFAATLPGRTAGLVLNHTAAKHLNEDGCPADMPGAAWRPRSNPSSRTGARSAARAFFPCRAGDERFRRWFAKSSRVAATPGGGGCRDPGDIPVPPGRHDIELRPGTP